MNDYAWNAADLIHYPLISATAMSPSGDRIAFTVRVAHLTEDASEFRHQLWLVNRTGGSVPRLIAHGESAQQPQWSPDGEHIAFVRKTAPGGNAGLWILPVNGGQPWCITLKDAVHASIASHRWSPDGKRIAFLAPPVDAEEQKRLARREDVIHWRVDFPYAQLFVQEVSGPEGSAPSPVQLTSAQRHVNTLAWSPDGRSIAYTHQDNTLDDSWTSLRLAVISANGAGEVRDFGPVTNREGPPMFSPDGRWIACEAGIENNHWPYAGGIHIISLEEGTSTPLAKTSDEHPALIGWDARGSGVYVINHTGICTEIDFLPADGNPAVPVCRPHKLITAVNKNTRDELALVIEDFHEPQSIYTLSLARDAEVTADRVAQPVNSQVKGPMPQVRHLQWRTEDGFDIEGILYLPADYDQDRDGALPMTLHIHGGPTAIFQRQYAATPYYYTPAALCERGIALLRCNPRGSGGYGKEFRFANMADWGGGDYRDLQQGVDTVIKMGVADPQRLGIAGWSYGGFMTSWTITQTDRFKAASIGAAVTNPVSFCGTADLPSFIPDYFNGESWEIPEFYRAHSPMAHVDNARTPSIMQHGGADERVPLEQGLQYFNALKKQGVPVDMFIYPRQGHAIDEPRLLQDAIQRNLDWFTHMLVDSGE